MNRLELLKGIFDNNDIPKLMSTAEEDNPKCLVKLVGTKRNWEWYVIEGDKEKGEFFGYVISDYPEAGTFFVDDLIVAGCYIDKEYVSETLDDLSKRATDKSLGNNGTKDQRSR